MHDAGVFEKHDLARSGDRVFLVVGDANVDLHASLERFPREGDDVAISGLGYSSGGSAANVATAFARLSGDARLLSRVGVDPFAPIALRAARSACVDLGFVQEDGQVATGLCFAAISPSGERTFLSSRGANVRLELPDLDMALRNVSAVHVAGHALLEDRQSETTIRLMEEANRRNLPISVDVCLPLLRRCPGKLMDALPTLQALFANELELEGIADALGYRESNGDRISFALSSLLARGAPLVLGKLGARGSVVAFGSASAHIPAFPIEAKDTTGAGDAFVAAFLFAHTHGASPTQAASFANAAGSLVAERLGAADAMPTLEEVVHRNRGSSEPWEPEGRQGP